MPFSDPIIGGASTLVRQAIKSPNYVAGLTGWSINKDGTAEFSGITVRGTIIANPFKTDVAPNPRVEILSGTLGEIDIYALNSSFATLQISGTTSTTWGGIGGTEYVGVLASADVHPTLGQPSFQVWNNPSGATIPSVVMKIPDKGANKGGEISLNGGVGGASLQLVTANSFMILDGPTGSGSIIGTGSLIVGNQAGNAALLTPADPGDTVFIYQRLKIPGTGTAGTPGFFFDGGASTGLYPVSTTAIGLSCNGSNVMEWNAGPQVIIRGAVFAPGLQAFAVANPAVEQDPANGLVYRFSSSRRFKDNIAPVRITATDRINALEITEYDPLSVDGKTVLTDKRRTGFIAEQVAQVAPEWVFTTPDGAIHGVDTEQVVASLVNYIQRLTQRVQRLTQRVQVLETRTNGPTRP